MLLLDNLSLSGNVVSARTNLGGKKVSLNTKKIVGGILVLLVIVTSGIGNASAWVNARQQQKQSIKNRFAGWFNKKKAKKNQRLSSGYQYSRENDDSQLQTKEFDPAELKTVYEKPVVSTPVSSGSATQPRNTEKSAEAPASNAMLDLINNTRSKNGLGTVKINNVLNQAAMAKARDMEAKNYFSHTTPEGKGDFAFIKEAGYRYSAVASNLAKGGFGSDQQVFDGWMNSSGHRANILNDKCNEIGYAKAGEYYVLFLAKPL